MSSKINDHTIVRSSGCIEWTGATSNGYGNINVGNNKWKLAHRVAWELEHGAIEDGLWVLHSCDNPLCVNVRHLFLGTHADNMKDMSLKKRNRRGINHHWAKLFDDSIRDIRTRRASGESRKLIAEMYGISPGHVTRIVNREAWSHVR